MYRRSAASMSRRVGIAPNSQGQHGAPPLVNRFQDIRGGGNLRHPQPTSGRLRATHERDSARVPPCSKPDVSNRAPVWVSPHDLGEEGSGPMNELERIAREASRLGDAPYLLATVVRVSGSSYRRPGARM